MTKRKWIIGTAVVTLVTLLGSFTALQATNGGVPPAGPLRRGYWRALGIKSGRLQIRVVDAFTQKGIDGAGCIVGETGDRIETDTKGSAPVIDAPVFRHPRLEQMLAELHGALTIMCYKNGYRDAIYMGVRMYEGVTAQPEIWMVPIGTKDRRVEPTLFQGPLHRLWQIQLVDKYRLFEEGKPMGEGPERPELSRPDTGQVSEPLPMGTEPQTPVRIAPPAPQPVPDRP
jgi:hypothetical protein